MRNRSRARRAARGGAGWILLWLAAGACATPDTNVWNLRQVHDPDGSASYTGNLRTDLEARLQGAGSETVIGGQRLPNVASFFGIEPASEQEPKSIRDPYATALENAVELASFDPERSDRVRALQVESFGWLASDSAFPLVRERSALELGRLGRLLGVEEPAALEEGVEPAGPEALSERLGVLVRAVRGDGDVEVAADELAALPLDVRGLHYALRTLTLLRFGGRAGGATLSPFTRSPHERLVEVHDELQRRMVSQALAAALDDRDPTVRAAGVEAAVVATRNGLPGLVQGAALRGGDEVVVQRALEMLEKRGIPRWQGEATAEEEAEYRRSWTGLCVGLLRNVYGGPVAVTAAQALQRLEPDGPDTLRPEDWILWYEETSPAAERP